jgi:hypothetical protein
MSPFVEVEGLPSNQGRVGASATSPRTSVADDRRDERPSFRAVLNRPRQGHFAATDEVAELGTSVAGRLGPALVASGRGEGVGAVGRTASGRIWIGRTAEVSTARVLIDRGALSGTELQLGALGPGLVTADLLGVGNGSRQTLATMIDEMRLRLRAKGITLLVPVRRALANANPEGNPGSVVRVVGRRAR